MRADRAFAQVDVFTDRPCLGNPVAVVMDGAGLSDATMQMLARWTNLSETTFVTPPTVAGADYAVRIFTPVEELPFAGHPTLGTAFALLDAGRIVPRDGRIVQQCAAGLIPVTVADDWRQAGLSFQLPAERISPLRHPDRIVAALGAVTAAPPVMINVGPSWIIADLGDAAVVRALNCDAPAMIAAVHGEGATGITVFGRGEGADGNAVAVRSLFPVGAMLVEDPVCGSGNGAVAAYRRSIGDVGAGGHYTASQGREIGRDGTILVIYGDNTIYIGGKCVALVRGHVAI